MRGRKPSDFKAGAAASEVSARLGGHEGAKRPLVARAPRSATTGCAAGQDMEVHFAHLDLRRGSKWIFRYGEPETAPLPSRLWLFGMYVVM